MALPFGGAGHAPSATLGEAGFGTFGVGAYWAACVWNMAA